MRAKRAALTAHLTFPLDGFQVRAMDTLDADESVLVAAPTGSGKTVVAEYGIALALDAGRRAFYTSPIKALSNQKFADLSALFGESRVGLLTGDNAINADADVVVMTTEVLRNMIYARSSSLDTLGCVVLDEVHYIQDAYRGPVWEEVIIHLAHNVQLVCLSATVSNAEELANWMSTVRGPTKAVIEEKRPVRLENMYCVGDKTNDRLHLLPTLIAGRANHEAQRIDEEGSRNYKGAKGRKIGARRTLYTPGRVEVVERLDSEDMLPAIFFIFSRNQCDEAALSALSCGLRLTAGEERDRIRLIADRRLDGIDPADLSVLGYSTFMACLEAGFAAHHAGMVPPFKEVVEACFTEGLIKVVFATETLAVGLNMPARSVVIEKLTKFTGDHHEFLKPGEYTQLTGRAGRRGIDTLGHAVVLWNPFVPFEQVAGLAASRSFHLSSAFRPTYNMACNLVRTYDSEQAHRLLNQSFAQYQADRDVVQVETRLQRRREHLSTLREKATSPFGDINEYRESMIASGDAAGRPSGRYRDAEAVEVSIMKLRPGDIIYVEKGRYAGKVTVLASAHRKGHMRLTVMTMRRESMQLTGDDFGGPVRALGSFALPTPFAPNNQGFQRHVVHHMERTKLTPKEPAPAIGPVASKRSKSFAHPVEADPELQQRLAAAAQADRIEREIVELSRRVHGASQSLAQQFDRVLRILATRGHVDSWRLTSRGRVLAGMFHECDLLITEALLDGQLDGLDPATMAGLVSVFTYEHRSPEAPPAAWFPSMDTKRRWRRIEQISAELADEEQQAGLTPHRMPDPTYVAVAFAWAAGESFADVVEAEELTGGDFVRNMRQLVDLLRQLGTIAPLSATRRTANQAADLLVRGVVEASNAVGASVGVPVGGLVGASAGVDELEEPLADLATSTETDPPAAVEHAG